MPKLNRSAAFALILLMSSGFVRAAQAQDTLNSTSGSNADAISGSQSGASSDNQNANVQGQTLNGNIGTSRSDSQSAAVSGSTSGSLSNSDQAQGQSLTNGNTNSLGQQATNQQGVTVSNTFLTTNHKRSYVGTNTAVPLAASSSFSSDYCGGTVSGGASAAPIGISLGGSGPVFDKSCQSLRRAEKFGMAAANYQNMQQPEMAMKLMSLMVWSICTADSQGPKADKATASACAQMLAMGDTPAPAGMYAVPPVPAAPQVTPLETQKPNVTPEPMAPIEPDYLAPKTPRGEIRHNNDNDTAYAATRSAMP